MQTQYILERAKNKNKKFSLKIIPEQGRSKTISFGAAGMSDFTKNHDPERMQRYTQRHESER